MKRSLSTAFLLAAFALPGAPQQTAQPQTETNKPVFQAGAQEVVLDVVVRDKKGHPVKDLKPGDFAVYDNDQPRPIKAMRLVEGGEAVSSSGVRTQLDPLRQIRLLTLIFDAMGPNSRILARDASMSLLKTDFPQNVYMAVMAIDNRLEGIQSFTNDRELLKKAIQRATGGAVDFSADSRALAHQLEQMLGPYQGGGQSLQDRVGAIQSGTPSAGPGGAASGAAGANAAMAQMMLQILETNREDVTLDTGRTSIYSLLAGIKEQYRLPGRKTVLYFSDGFSIPQGLEEAFQSMISIANRSNVSIYTIDAHGLSTTDTNQGAIDALNNAASSSKTNSTTNNAVNRDSARGTDQVLTAGRADVQDAMMRLALATGGAFIGNTNDFKTPLRKLEEDIQSYYEITYDPQIQNYDGSFHKTKVTTDIKDLRIQARSGYFALPPAMTAQGQVLSLYEVPLLKALDATPVPSAFQYESQGLHFRGASGTPTCDLVLDVPLSNLTLQQDKASGEYQGKLAYEALVKDSQGQVVKKFHSEVPLKITADKLEAYRASHFIYAQPFDLPQGKYTLETAVLDGAAEKISARKSSFLMPAQAGALGISSVAYIRNTKPKEPTTPANDPLMLSDKVITPTLNPIIKKSEAQSLPFFVVIYPNKASADKPALQMIFAKDGQTLGSGSPPLTAPDAQGRIEYVAMVPAASLPPGNYQVQFVAKQGSETAQESITFTLQ